MNERMPNATDQNGNFTNTALFAFKGNIPAGWLVREVLTVCESYKCAFDRLSSAKMVTPTFFILSGLSGNEAAVITRDPESVVNVRTLTDQNWFLVQTNQDHFKGDCRKRCWWARFKFLSIGESNISMDRMYKEVLTAWPNLNELSIYAVATSPATGYFQVYRVWGHNETDSNVTLALS